MLQQATVDEIRRLLTAGQWSMRKIARELRVCRGTVGAIAHGRRKDRVPKERDDDLLLPRGPPQRCPGCGGMVLMPCLLCRVRRRIRKRRYYCPEQPGVDPHLELVGQDRDRYEQARRRLLHNLTQYGELGGPTMSSGVNKLNVTYKLAPGTTEEQAREICLIFRWTLDYLQEEGVPLPVTIMVDDGEAPEKPNPPGILPVKDTLLGTTVLPTPGGPNLSEKFRHAIPREFRNR